MCVQGESRETPIGLHAQLVELGSPVTQELHLVRSGGGPVEEVEDEQLRPVLDELEHRERLAPGRGTPCLGDAVADFQHPDRILAAAPAAGHSRASAPR